MATLKDNIENLRTLQQSYSELVDGMPSLDDIKAIIAEAIAKTDSTSAIREKIAEALHTTIGTEATYDLIERVAECVDKLYEEVALKDYDVSNMTLEEVINVLSVLLDEHPVVSIQGSKGFYSAAEWSAYVEEHGMSPDTSEGIAVRTPFQEFMVGLANPTKTWGTYEASVPNLPSSQTGSFYDALKNNLVFTGLTGTQQLILFANPQLLGEPYCLEFDTYADLEAYEGGKELSNLQVYVVKNDETQSGTSSIYIWDGTAFSRRGSAPYMDTKKTSGSPAAEYSWNYKLPGDRQWFLPTINHLLIISAYMSEINECRAALGALELPSSNCWSCQQYSASFAYYVALSSGAVNGGIKSATFSVVPVAAL